MRFGMVCRWMETPHRGSIVNMSSPRAARSRMPWTWCWYVLAFEQLVVSWWSQEDSLSKLCQVSSPPQEAMQAAMGAVLIEPCCLDARGGTAVAQNRSFQWCVSRLTDCWEVFVLVGSSEEVSFLRISRRRLVREKYFKVSICFNGFVVFKSDSSVRIREP